jgi:arginase family enzyme
MLSYTQEEPAAFPCKVAKPAPGHLQVVAFPKPLTKAAPIPGRLAFNGIGMDMMEVSPPYDHAELTALVAETPGIELVYVPATNRKQNRI